MPTAVLLGRALFTSALLLFWLPAFACAPDRIDAVVKVDWVYDGDTVRLEDGRKLRLIGINTPELGHGEAPDEPYAERAKQALRQTIDSSDHQLRIRYGDERKDHYGRLLAHAFTLGGRSISAILIKQGLGAAITVPPNDWNADCYHQAERSARQNETGIWKQRVQGPTDSTRLPHDYNGFHIVTGRVKRIGESRRSTWVNLEGDVALRIDHADKANFSGLQFDDLQGAIVEARGWVYVHKGQPRIRIRHPRSLVINKE